MWSRSSASTAGSSVALCGGRGGHRLLTCVAAPARRRAAGTAASAKRITRSALRASVTPDFVTAAPDEAVEESSVERPPASENKLSKLACPICYYPLVSSSDQSAKFSATSSLECSTCKKFYPNRGDYWDMTVAVGFTEYSESTTVTTEVFRTPLVSFLYERGWRQNFIWGGFPGLEREVMPLLFVCTRIFDCICKTATAILQASLYKCAA